MSKTMSLSLHIINQVLIKRLALGMSARRLSLILEHGESYVSKIEDNLQVNSYPAHQLTKLASALHCEVHDLLPADKSTSMGELVEKKLLSLSDENDVRKVIHALKEYGFFDKESDDDNNEITNQDLVTPEMTLERVVKHLNVQDEAQVKVLKKVLNS